MSKTTAVLGRGVVVVVAKDTPEAVIIAAKDTVKYLNKACEGMNARLKLENKLSEEDLAKNLIVVGYEDSKRTILGISPVKVDLANDDYSVRILRNPANFKSSVILLDGNLLGKQFACYYFCEKFLGVLFLRPDFEHIPAVKNIVIPEKAVIVERSRYKYRGIWAWSYNHVKEKMNWMEFIYWKENNDIFRLLKLADWVVKNRQNILFWYSETYFNGNRCYMPEEYQTYIEKRGLSRVEMISPGSAEGKRPDWKDSDYCADKKGNLIGTWNTHLCYNTDKFWEMVDEHIKKVRATNLAGVIVTWSEAGCGHPGHCDTPENRCAKCGHIPNATKHLKVVNYVKRKLLEKGIDVPVGHYRHWKMGENGDKQHAEAILNKAEKKFVTLVHTCGVDVMDIYSHWWKLTKQLNKKKADLKIWYCPETLVFCKADTPIVNLLNFDSRNYDFVKLQKEENTEFHVVNLPTLKFFTWQFAHYCMINQWNYKMTWQNYIGGIGKTLFGEKSGEALKKSLECLFEVELVKRSKKYGKDFQRKYSYMYGDIVFLELEKTFGVRTEQEFAKKTGSIKKDVAYYENLTMKSEAYLNLSAKECKANNEFLESDFLSCMRWTISLFKFRLAFLKSLCFYFEALKNPAKSKGKLEVALQNVRRAIDGLNLYNRLVPYCGSDLLENLDVLSLEKLEAKILNAIDDPGSIAATESLSSTLKDIFAADKQGNWIFENFITNSDKPLELQWWKT